MSFCSWDEGKEYFQAMRKNAGHASTEPEHQTLYCMVTVQYVKLNPLDICFNAKCNFLFLQNLFICLMNNYVCIKL